MGPFKFLKAMKFSAKVWSKMPVLSISASEMALMEMHDSARLFLVKLLSESRGWYSISNIVIFIGLPCRTDTYKPQYCCPLSRAFAEVVELLLPEKGRCQLHCSRPCCQFTVFPTYVLRKKRNLMRFFSSSFSEGTIRKRSGVLR